MPEKEMLSDKIIELVNRLCFLGKEHREIPRLDMVEPFKHFFTSKGEINIKELDSYDGSCKRREILTRFLLLSIVLDQGPDLPGIRDLAVQVTNLLYRREVRIFHRPIDFFRELGISIDEIIETHNSIKRLRADTWAKKNKSSPEKYNLIFTQSPRGIISTKQVLDFAIHRWGVPLCVPLLLEKDWCDSCRESGQALVDFIECWPSAEVMSRQIKEHQRYGMGSAVGDKACHLFAKMYVSRFYLASRRDKGWNGISYELPFDSNAGRVLFRTGFLLNFASLKDMERWNVIQHSSGKGGVHHIRVTNLRDKKIDNQNDLIQDINKVIVRDYLKVGKTPRKVSIQHIPNILLYYINSNTGMNYSIADFDDGLIYIGLKFCYNTDTPVCELCEISDICKGNTTNKTLITKYRT